MKRRRSNPVAKWMEQGETRCRPTTIDTKKDKQRRGKVKYKKQYLEGLQDE